MKENDQKTEPTTADSKADTSANSNKPRWIHDTVEDPSYFGGIKRLPSCVCSNCGYHTNREKPVCPGCRAKMK